MRLSADILGNAEQRPNALGEREIVLRGLAIPAIEHLGATRDAFDTIDLTENRITRIENFPKLQRLSTLMLAGNAIAGVDARNLASNLPNLTTLVLTDNQISGLHQVSKIAEACPKLEYLSLRGNPVVLRQYYRLYVINKMPALKVLDFTKVKQAEREKAQRLAMSAAGAALESDVRMDARNAAAASSKTFVPGEGSTAEESFTTNFTNEQKEQIRKLVSTASSPEEIERIEESVKRGVFPTLSSSARTPPLVAEKRAEPDRDESNTTSAAKNSRV